MDQNLEPLLVKCEWCNTRYKITNPKNITKEKTKARCKKCNKLFRIAVKNRRNESNPKYKYEDDKYDTSPFIDNSLSEYNTDFYKNEGPSSTITKFPNKNAKSISIEDKKIKIGIRKKFNFALICIMIVSLCGTYITSNFLFQKSAEHKVVEDARFLLNTMEASRSFTGKVLKPALYRELPGKFVVEGMSSSFGARNIFERIKKKYPEYYFKHAAPHPRNILNLADDFETNIIRNFNSNPNKKEWYGYRGKDDGKDFIIMKPIVAEERCMKCHSVPEQAPKEVIERYGDKAAFDMTVGDVVAALTVSVPATKIFVTAQKNTIILNIIIAFCFITLIAIINLFFENIVLKPIRRLKESVNEISIGNLNVPIHSEGNDELSDLAVSFERMRVSISMAIQRFNLVRSQQRRH